MVFVLGDDSVLDVYPSPGDVPHDIEGLDIESMLALCDERGRRYAVEWVWPNRHGRFLWLLPWSASGVYRLRPDGPPDPAVARSVVQRAVGLGRPGPFASLSEVRALVAEPGAAADRGLNSE